VDEGTTVTLNGTGSSDPNPGQTLTYAWTQLSGPPVTINNANMAMATCTAPALGTLDCEPLVFQLKVTDSCGAMATDTVTIDVSDRFVLADDNNNNCVVVRRMCGTNMGTYCWKKPNGSTVSGPVTIMVTPPGTVTIMSKDTDPNLFQGGADLTRNRGNARLVEPRNPPGPASVIIDSNVSNSTCACP
jgi:hypothetical protein